MAIFPTDPQFTTPITATNSDKMLIADASDSNNLKSVLPSSVVAAWLPSNTSDLLPEWTNNLYMTPGERVKLASVEAWAQVNAVTSVNGQVLAVSLDQDDIPDGTTYVRTQNDFTDTNVVELNAASNHLTNFSNPHDTTAAQVWLWNVTNDTQLSTTPGNFSALVEKSDIQQHLEDLFVLQDSNDNNIIKKVTNKTDLIWKASLCQIWGSSINYYRFNFVGSTTYDIRSIVVFGNTLYQCTVNHQSSGSFAADLWLWYWVQVGTGGGGGGVSVTAGSWSPTNPGTSAGDLYIDTTNNQLYIWDGSVWNLYISPLVFPTTTWSPVAPGTIVWQWAFDPADGNIYIWTGASRVSNTSWGSGGVNYATAPTTIWNKIVFSFGVNADIIDESVISYTATPVPTIDMGWVVTTWIQNFDENYVANYDGSVINIDNTTINYLAPTLISCQLTPAFATPYTYPALTNQVQVVSGANTIYQAINQWTITYTVTGGEISINTTPTQVTVAIVSWTPTLDDLCYYQGNVVNNNGTIIMNDVNTQVNGGTYNNTILNNTTINNPILTWVNASDVNITDAWGYYTSTDVEGALQEIGADIDSILSTSWTIIAWTAFTAQSNSNVESTSWTTPTLVRQYTMNKTGTYRHETTLTRWLWSWTGGINSQIYKNWLPFGVINNRNSTTPAVFTEDLSWTAWDSLELYIRAANWSTFGDNNSFETKFSFDYSSYITVVNP